MREDTSSPSPVILAAGLEETVTVDMVNYVARWIGYDAEECILKALEDGEIEMYRPSILGRGYDVYRLTAKGCRESEKHIREVFQRGAEAARRLYEDELKGNTWAAAAVAAHSAKSGPPADAATAPLPPPAGS